MGSSRSEYYRHEVTWDDLKDPTREMAWKKSGFQDRDTLLDHVRLLPLEDRIDLLTEHFLVDMSKVYLQRRQEFMENLGQSICVSREEILEYAARVYPSLGVDTLWIEPQYHIDASNLDLIHRRKKR